MHLCGIAVSSSHAHQKSKELLMSEATDARNQKDIEQAVSTAQSSFWKNGQVLDYSFFGGSPDQHTKVEDVIQEWTWYANVTFSRSTPNNRDATLRIAFDPTKGSWSYVGSTARSCDRAAPTMNLGWIADNATLTKQERGIILHEFGHALGLMHEHESPAYSGVIRLKEAEVLKYYAETQGWDATTVRKQVLNVYSKEYVSNYHQFDPTSIMTYFIPAAMNEGGVDIPVVTELSMLDKAFAVAIYPRDRPHPRANQWTPQFALMAMGASLDAVTLYALQKDVDVKRNVFRKEMVELRLHEAKRVQLQTERKIPHAPGTIFAVVKSAPSDAEKLQKAILSLLFNIAPKSLLASHLSLAGTTVKGTRYAALDFKNITLEHPIVQQGLVTFFEKLTSNRIVKKAMTSSVKSTLDYAVREETHTEKVQNSILSLLFGIAPKSLLVADTSNGNAVNGTHHTSLSLDNLTLDHPVVQRGLTSFFVKLISNKIMKPVFIDAVKLSGVSLEIQHTVQETYIEKIQNRVLSLLFSVAPKDLLSVNISASVSVINGTQQTILDVNSLTLDHPVVQQGLATFFEKLTSNKVVTKVMTSAVKLTGTVVDVQPVPKETHVEKVRNRILSLLFSVASKDLLVSTVSTTSSVINGVQYSTLDVNSLTLDHPVVQHGLETFFKKLTSNGAVKNVMKGAVKLDVEYAVREETHAEKVQNGILSLLFGISPKVLLAPNTSSNTIIKGVHHAPLHPNNLSLDNPIVQRGLTNFFLKLMSNEIVMKTMTSAFQLAGGAVNFSYSLQETYAEKVQRQILSLLFGTAPKNLLASTVSSSGAVINGVHYGVFELENLTLNHPVVQNGLITFFQKLASHELLKATMTGAVKLAGGTIVHREETYSEKIQNRIISLLFNIAPKDILTAKFSTFSSVVKGVQHVDVDSLTLEHPAVQQGLMGFFEKLTSNKIIQTTMTGAVKLSTSVIHQSNVQRDEAHIQKIQSGILSLLLKISPLDLVVSDTFTGSIVNEVRYMTLDPSNLTLDHPAVQQILTTFFTKLTSNEIVKKTMTDAVKLAIGTVETVQETHTEKVQNNILSLLLSIAPKDLLAPTISTSGSIVNGVQYVPLDLHNLTLEHPAVQHGLMSFFTKLATNKIVRVAMTNAMKLTVDQSTDVGLALKTNTVAISAEQLTQIVALIIADSRFKNAISALSGTKVREDESSRSEFTITVTKKASQCV